ncbi:beta-ketoacyl synthase N-terminal-like domain-containing protein [Streptomyces sp. NBC_00091]|uniref:beta-ketoacyl synthase N-terminal-like domain-containing protein n=1 Tax=Streptomyces sp. NBC_00091 TaxID=2975648 RepID=UPI00225AB22F|nr:beta-ketoacyl synthase N-terminal-like domain-containing protein [Streptomyces sp. NBC_00091]MCX5375331.1 3-oxoacyl-ACP synthase [Streptomyces sp. NBC_00091]
MTSDASGQPVISAWSALSPWGEGAAAFREGLGTGREALSVVDSEFRPGTSLRAGIVPGVRMEYAGTRGVRSLDRLTRLTLLLSGLLLDDQGGSTGTEPEDTGMVFATSGSAKSGLDFTTASYAEAKPFHVDPSRFPSTAANCAASRSAIWYGLKGPNTTLTGGDVGGLLALAQAGRLLRQGRAEVLLAGAGEEYTEDRVLLEDALRGGPGQAPPLAEGGALFLLESAEGAAARGRTPLAVLRGSRFRAYHPERGGSAGQALLRCVTDLLGETGTDPGAIGLTVSSDPSGPLGAQEDAALAEVFARAGAQAGAGAGARAGAPARRIAPAHRIGHGGSAASAFQTAAALAADGEGPLRAPVLITSVEEGRVGATLLGRPAG